VKIQAAVVWEAGAPLSIEELDLERNAWPTSFMNPAQTISWRRTAPRR
jgi:hypothetical protein